MIVRYNQLENALANLDKEYDNIETAFFGATSLEECEAFKNYLYDLEEDMAEIEDLINLATGLLSDDYGLGLYGV